MVAKSMFNDSIAGPGQKRNRSSKRSGRSLPRLSKPRFVLSSKKAAALIPEQLHEWDERYGLPVLRGQVVVGEYVYLAVLRHYRDLQTGAKRGLNFSSEHALHIIDFIERFFVHIKGPLAGQPILLDPWQKFWTAVLYGWRRADGYRRFTRAYEEVARKNGKSTWKGPQGMYLLAMDGEIGAEVYAVATTREQAKTVFKPAFDNVSKWCRKSPRLAKSFKVFSGLNQEKIVYDTSVFAPLPAMEENLDGLNPYAILFDELHAQKSRGVWDVMESALGARKAPLLSAITTSGFILDGICVEIRDYCLAVLRGDAEDDSFFGYVYTLDRGDDPFDERVWCKANPGLGMSKQIDYMRTQALKAKRTPGARVNFMTKDLNIWCNSADGYYDLDVWDSCGKKFDPEILRGRRCYGGLDLASTRDLTAYSLVFPSDEPDEPWYVLVWFFCPQSKIDNEAHNDKAPYAAWQDAGWLTATDGNVTDYAVVKRAILESLRDYDVQKIGYDRWNALQLVNELMDLGAPMVEIPQNTGGMYPGTKALDELIYSGRLQHGGNPVLRWNAVNVSMLYDTNGNYRPDKKRSQQNGRIDGVVATVMACTLASEPVAEFNAVWNKGE